MEHTEAAAPGHPYADRRRRLVDVLAAAGTSDNQPAAEALLVTDPVNVRYLCGFTGSNGALLVTADAAVLATDGRYTEQAAAESPDVELVVTRQLTTELLARSRTLGAGRVGFEAEHLTVAAHRRLADAVPDGDAAMAAAGGRVELVAAGRLVEALRVHKDESEIALLTEACAITDRALADVLVTLRPGMTEREVAHALEARMLAHGAEARAFSTIVATGPHSSIPHHQPTDRPIAAGDLLKMDFGALAGGYHADMTRTVVVGAEPAGWQRDLYALVAEAQRRGREALAVGAALRDVDLAARSVIADAGHAEHFPHGLGHGVGLVIHEDPFFSHAATGTLDDRTPVTVEPGVYLPGRGGVRIEDTLVVRAGGTPTLLTQSTKELLVLA